MPGSRHEARTRLFNNPHAQPEVGELLRGPPAHPSPPDTGRTLVVTRPFRRVTSCTTRFRVRLRSRRCVYQDLGEPLTGPAAKPPHAPLAEPEPIVTGVRRRRSLVSRRM